MGFDLHRRKTDAGPFEAEYFCCNCTGWSWLTETGAAHGWGYPGTTAPLPHVADPDDPLDESDPPDAWDEWSGGYMTNDGQYVTAADAASWADALERGKPYDRKSPRWLEYVDEFIAYCREGGFEIH